MSSQISRAGALHRISSGSGVVTRRPRHLRVADVTGPSSRREAPHWDSHRFGVTATFAKRASAPASTLRPVTARPTYTVSGMETTSVPSAVHVTPSADWNALSVAPRRSSFSHTGDGPGAPDEWVLKPPVTSRR